MIFTAVYLICFSLLLVGAFSLMSQGFRDNAGLAAARSSARRPAVSRSRHPEAPEPGEALLYVDLSRERLEQLYEKSA